MDKDINDVRLVKQAQLGDKECLERLARLAQESLHENVYRITLEPDLTQDIVQETVLEMLRILGKLEKPDRFWPWLYKMALNKIRRHHKRQKHRRTVPLCDIPDLDDPKSGQQAMSNLVAEELRQIVFQAISKLRHQHRVVLTLRCYKEMDYPTIARSLGCSEFAARKLFWRAKNALQRQLARHGFAKGSLLMALVVFGKMTAPTEAASAKVSVTAAATKVGAAAALAGMAASKTAVISLAAAGAVGAGVFVAASDPGRMTGIGDQTPGRETTVQIDRPAEVCEEYFYFPEGKDGPVLMRSMQGDLKSKRYDCQWVQDAQANYYLEQRKNIVRIEDYRPWLRDLSVRRLPTDSKQLQDNLSAVEGKVGNMRYTTADGRGLLVVVERAGNGSSTWAMRHRHVLEEEYFKFSRPAGAQVIDNRDAMHYRGWTYFMVEGRIGEGRLSGTGRIPFVYAAGAEHHPWLKLNIGDRLEIIDDGRQAIVRKAGKITASYQGGSFFKGLSRPWMGLHTLDSVRRDAAEQELPFETNYSQQEKKTEVVLTAEQRKIVYTIDMEKDVVEKITISTGQGTKGELRFSYLQDIDKAGYRFSEPRISRRYGSLRRKSPGLLWLLELGTKPAQNEK
jgi:RNA polymerase sigma-70 factor (ECF subfamily)